jgi:hypothetical protein
VLDPLGGDVALVDHVLPCFDKRIGLTVKPLLGTKERSALAPLREVAEAAQVSRLEKRTVVARAR